MGGSAGSGAQNAYAFSSAMESGRMPDKDTLTYQGCFNEHFYFAGRRQAKSACEAAAFPIMRGGQPWLAVYLKSVLDGQPRDPTPIDLSVVIDISGSMKGHMSHNEGPGVKTRLDHAKLAVHWLVKEVLRDDDCVALSVFNNDGQNIHGLTDVSEMRAGGGELAKTWLQAVDTIQCTGGTILSSGMTVGRSVFDLGAGGAGSGSSTRERRILFLTDMAEMGATELGKQIASYAKEGVNVSIVGMGVEFNAELTDTVTANKGAIYSSATSKEQLRQVVVDDFAYNSFPVAFDVNLSIRSGDLDVLESFGTPFDTTHVADSRLSALGWDEDRNALYPPEMRAVAAGLRGQDAPLPLEAVAKVMAQLEPPRQSVTEVNTFFPGRMTDGCIRGGLVLVRLGAKAGAKACSSLELTLECTDRAGAAHAQTDVLHFDTSRGAAGNAFFDAAGRELGAPEETADPEADARLASGLAKGLLLHRYVHICRAHMDMEAPPQKAAEGSTPGADDVKKAAEGSTPAAEDAKKANGAQKDPKQVCADLRRALDEVKAAIAADFAADPVVAALSGTIDSFVESFEKCYGPKDENDKAATVVAAST